jgi:hypothetical protein
LEYVLALVDAVVEAPLFCEQAPRLNAETAIARSTKALTNFIQ